MGSNRGSQLLLLLLSHLSRVRLLATPWSSYPKFYPVDSVLQMTAFSSDPYSLSTRVVFNNLTGLPATNFLTANLSFLPVLCVLVAQSCPAFCHPMDCSPPGSSVHGIFQARILEWVAISFVNSLLLLE